MPLFFELDEEELRYELRIMFDHEHDESSMALWLRDILSTASSLDEKYKSFIQSSGKLTAPDRAALIDLVDQIITDLCMFQKKMYINMEEEQIKKLQLEQKVPVKAAPNNFTARGSMNQEDLYGIETFNKSFQIYILGNIKLFLEQYRKIVNPRVVNKTPDFEAVLSTIDTILYYLLIMRFNVNNYLIDK